MAPGQKATVRRSRTKKQREEASTGTIQYDLTAGSTQHRQAGRAKRSPDRERKVRLPAIPALADRGTLGPSGLPMLRTSERSTFKRCRFLYELEYLRMLKPNVDTPPLFLGSMIHVALAGYYKKGIRRGPHPAGLFEAAVRDESERVAKLTKRKPHALIDDWRERVDLGVGMLNNYIDHYGKDDEWKVLAVEVPFRVIVTHPVQGGGGVVPWFWYTGILDLLLESRRTGHKRIRDHKTATAIATKYLALDDQVTAYYTWGVEALRNSGALGPQEKIEGIDFNFLRKIKPDERPWRMEAGEDGVLRKYHLNLDGTVSKKQPAPYFHRHFIPRHRFEMDHARRRVLNEYRDMESVRRNPAEMVYKNPTSWTCPGCWAFDICELHEVGADHESVIAATTHTWNPYDAHEIFVGETH